ncbi:MAG: DUF4105 domain-containing protein [bacterium]|nr:DUF4105 domain-containing protein [bacterium]
MSLPIVVASLLTAVFVAYYVLRKPSNHGPWSLDHGFLPYATTNGENVTIYNVRSFTYFSEESYRTNYETRNYDLSKIKSIEYILEDFMRGDYSGHAFVTFGFDDEQYVSFSIEARRRPWQKFNPYLGCLRRFTLIYLVADESDVVRLRAVNRKDDVRMYPIKATKEQSREVFVSFIQKMNKLRKKAEYYNTAVNSCGNGLFSHLQIISKKYPVYHPDAIFLTRSDTHLLKKGLIQTNLNPDKAREHFLINRVSNQCADDKNFSRCIRIRR